MSVVARINRPEYLFQPTAVLKRLRPRGRAWRRPGVVDEAELPWAQTIDVFRDGIGRGILFTGVFDPCVTEAIHRLLDPGDRCVDVGANVGYLTNLMAARVGPGGSVVAYEPHPAIFAVLERNATRWDADGRVGAVTAEQLALSSRSGSGALSVGPHFGDNMGLAALAGETDDVGGEVFEVPLARLDDLLGEQEVQLLKLDVEGHEHDVLCGAERLLAERRVRDVVFEDRGVYPTGAMELLEQRGLSVFTLKHAPWGLRVHPAREGPAPRGWPGPNYLATVDPDRALGRLRPPGWRSLALGPGGRLRMRRALANGPARSR